MAAPTGHTKETRDACTSFKKTLKYSTLIELGLLGKPHIYRFCPQETPIVRLVCVCVGGGGGVTFLCDTSWENFIFFLKKFELFGNIVERDIKQLLP